MSNLPPPTKKFPNHSRNVSLDWISGIMISVMIISHSYLFYTPDWLHFIQYVVLITFFMFMPWFFFKAGMFAKSIPTERLFKQSYKRLFYPWLIFGVLSIPISFLLVIRHPTEYIEWIQSIIQCIFYDMAFPGNLALWYLIALFACRVLMNTAFRSHQIWPYIVATFGLTVAFLLRLYDQLPWIHGMVFPSIFIGLFFYSCGYIFKKIQYTRKVLFISIAILVLLSFVEPNVHNFGIDVRVNGSTSSLLTYILFYPRALCAIVISITLQHYFQTYIWEKAY